MVYNRIKKNKSHFIFTSQLQTFNNNIKELFNQKKKQKDGNY